MHSNRVDKIVACNPRSKCDLLDEKEKLISKGILEKKQSKTTEREKKRGMINFYQRKPGGERVHIRSYRCMQRSRYEIEIENLINVRTLLQDFSDLLDVLA